VKPSDFLRLREKSRPKPLIIDEVGNLALEQADASLLFQAICERYEKRQAIILTSNKAFATGARSSPTTPSWPPPRSTGCCTDPPSSTSEVTATGSKRNDWQRTPPPESR